MCQYKSIFVVENESELEGKLRSMIVAKEGVDFSSLFEVLRKYVMLMCCVHIRQLERWMGAHWGVCLGHRRYICLGIERACQEYLIRRIRLVRMYLQVDIVVIRVCFGPGSFGGVYLGRRRDICILFMFLFDFVRDHAGNCDTRRARGEMRRSDGCCKRIG